MARPCLPAERTFPSTDTLLRSTSTPWQHPAKPLAAVHRRLLQVVNASPAVQQPIRLQGLGSFDAEGRSASEAAQGLMGGPHNGIVSLGVLLMTLSSTTSLACTFGRAHARYCTLQCIEASARCCRCWEKVLRLRRTQLFWFVLVA